MKFGKEKGNNAVERQYLKRDIKPVSTAKKRSYKQE